MGGGNYVSQATATAPRPGHIPVAKGTRGGFIFLREPSVPAGYSNTSLAKKLGVKDAQRTWRLAMPLTVATGIAAEGVRPILLEKPVAGLEMAHIFVTRRAVLAKELARLRKLLAPAGILWVSWPKKAAKLETDITEDTIREEALPLGLVDVKVCAVDATWSGLNSSSGNQSDKPGCPILVFALLRRQGGSAVLPDRRSFHR